MHIYVHIFVYMYIYVYVCTYIYIYVHEYTRMYIYMYTYMYNYLHICTNICTTTYNKWTRYVLVWSSLTILTDQQQFGIALVQQQFGMYQQQFAALQHKMFYYVPLHINIYRCVLLCTTTNGYVPICSSPYLRPRCRFLSAQRNSKHHHRPKCADAYQYKRICANIYQNIPKGDQNSTWIKTIRCCPGWGSNRQPWHYPATRQRINQ